MGMKRAGLPAHVEEAINKATPEQLAAMLKPGVSPGYRRPKAKKPKPAAVVVEKTKKQELAELRAEWRRVVKVNGCTAGMVELVVPYPISANRYWRTRVVVPNGNPRAAFASTYVSEEAELYKEVVREFALAEGLKPLLGEVEVEIHLYRPQRSGDLDNRIKVLLDALREIIYPDDSVICTIYAQRHEDKNNPRALVRFSQKEKDLFGGMSGE